MATVEMMATYYGFSQPQFQTQVGTANLRRNQYANTSNGAIDRGTCEGAGVGYTYEDINWGKGNCYFPCPDLYTISATDPRQCEPRPLLTKLSIYEKILAQAVKSCAELIPAYKDAVAEANNDPSQVGFPAGSGCVNPYDPPAPPPPTLPEEYVPPAGDGLPNPAGSNENTTSDGVFDPSASNGDPTKPQDAPPMTDPNGSSGQAGQQNGGIDGTTGEPFIPTQPDGTKQEPYIPPPPASYRDYDEYDESGISTVLPRGRLLVTDEEIAQLPKVNDYGTMTEGDLAIRLQQHPTLLDSDPAYLTEFIAQVPSFVWECSITQKEFDLLPDDWKCRLCGSYDGTIYGNPSNITYLRGYAPTITMTRNAPSTAPTFENCPQVVKKVACESKTGWGGGACSYSGGCDGNCICPSPPDTSSSSSSSALGANTGLFIAGGVAVVAFVLFR